MLTNDLEGADQWFILTVSSVGGTPLVTDVQYRVGTTGCTLEIDGAPC